MKSLFYEFPEINFIIREKSLILVHYMNIAKAYRYFYFYFFYYFTSRPGMLLLRTK